MFGTVGGWIGADIFTDNFLRAVGAGLSR